MNSTLPVSYIVTALIQLTPDTTLFTLQSDQITTAASFLPGQFIELSLPGVGEIPISYCGRSSTDGVVELCIRHVGHVTSALRGLAAGSVLAVRGPFGRGFPLELYSGKNLLLIAGGIGIAPLRALLLDLCLN